MCAHTHTHACAPTGGTGPRLQNLQTLDLSANQIADFEQGTFSGMTGLRSLSLRGNQISGSVANDTFADLSALTRLDLADNKLTGFQEGAFSSLQELRTLYLQGNHLKGTQWLAQSEGDTCGGVLLRNGFVELTDSGGHACTLSVFLSLLSRARSAKYVYEYTCIPIYRFLPRRQDGLAHYQRRLHGLAAGCESALLLRHCVHCADQRPRLGHGDDQRQ
jgi:hypothetical protein